MLGRSVEWTSDECSRTQQGGGIQQRLTDHLEMDQKGFSHALSFEK